MKLRDVWKEPWYDWACCVWHDTYDLARFTIGPAYWFRRRYNPLCARLGHRKREIWALLIDRHLEGDWCVDRSCVCGHEQDACYYGN